jgi:hypothetical protein
MPPNASPMGQVILGFRSLLVKIAVFVVMAAMLAWILGGTLWPKTAVRIVGEPVEVDGVRWALVDQIGGPLDRATFGFARLDDRGRPIDLWPRAEDMTPAWGDAIAPVASPDGSTGAVAYAVVGEWKVLVIVNGATEDWRSTPDAVVHEKASNRWAAVRRLEEIATAAAAAQSDDAVDASADGSTDG